LITIGAIALASKQEEGGECHSKLSLKYFYKNLMSLKNKVLSLDVFHILYHKQPYDN